LSEQRQKVGREGNAERKKREEREKWALSVL